MEWTWDPAKNRENIRKHGVHFEDAVRVFLDTNYLTTEDSYPYEQRWRTMGTVGPSILIVVHTWPNPGDQNQTGRIISARKTTRHERAFYEEP